MLRKLIMHLILDTNFFSKWIIIPEILYFKSNSTLIPTPRSYKEIISVNKNNAILSSVSEIHELEIGHDRCNISG